MGLLVYQCKMDLYLTIVNGSCGLSMQNGPVSHHSKCELYVTILNGSLFNTSNHKLLIPSIALSGSILMLICDCIAQIPNSELTLPINAVTSLVGAPVVIWLLIRKKQLFA